MPMELEARRLLAPLNVLVNDPSADSTNQDTQSETTSIAFGNTPTGRLQRLGELHVLDEPEPALHRLRPASTDGGQTFTESCGALPASSEGDAGDPILARDAVSGRIYMSTLGFNTGDPIQVFRSDDNGATFQSPVNGTRAGRAPTRTGSPSTTPRAPARGRSTWPTATSAPATAST